jgi:SAM-dependent methyltransferase
MANNGPLIPALTIADRLTSTALRTRFDELCVARPDIQLLRWILGTPEQQLQWIHSIGVTSDSILGDLVPSAPPLPLRQIVAAPELEIFLWTGFKDICTLLKLFEDYQDSDRGSPYRVLDFGCGCGRLTRFFSESPEQWTAFGSDINPDHVSWCQGHLPAVKTILNGPTPPLDFADGSMDFVWCLSVFSHLPDDQARQWLIDLARVIRPGGILLITTHGKAALNIIARSAVHQQMFSMTPQRAAEVTVLLDSDGYVMQNLAPEVVEVSKAAEGYGNCFVSESYVRSAWSGVQFELCAFLPGGLRGWQDISVLRRI